MDIFRNYTMRRVTYDDGIDLLERGQADIFLAVGVPRPYHFNIQHLQPFYRNW